MLREVRLLQLQVGVGDGEIGLGAVQRGLGAVALGSGGIERLLGGHALLRQFAGARQRLLVFLERHLRGLDIGRGGLGGGLGALDLGFQPGRVEPGQHVALLDLLVLVHRDGAHHAGQLARYVDLGQRLKGAGGGDLDGEIGDRDRLGRVVDARRRTGKPLVAGHAARNDDQRGQRIPPHAAAAPAFTLAVEPEGRLDCRSGIRFWPIDNLVQGGPLCCRTSLWVEKSDLTIRISN
jgi:hypothetical protein